MLPTQYRLVPFDSKQDKLIQPDVLVVGAGPVGLWTAIQLQLRDPTLKILMLEKYTEYKRSHLLMLGKGSYFNTHKDKRFQALIADFPVRIKTTDIETQLLAFARQIGIKIKYQKVDDCKTLNTEYPSAKTIIAADGAHSIVREQIFHNVLTADKNLKYVAEIKYEALGEVKPLKIWKEAIPTLTCTHHLVSELVGREKNGKTSVSIRIFIDEKTFNEMKEARGGTFYSLKDKTKITVELMHSMEAWLNAREILVGEKRVPDSEKITVTNLSVYSSAEFVREEAGVSWCLVGDSAFGVPYFRSLNNGLLCGTKLAAAIYNHLHFEEELEKRNFSSLQPQPPLSQYSDYVKTLARNQVRLAKIKTTGVSSLEASATTIQWIPVKSVKLPQAYKAHMHEVNEEKAQQDKALSTSFSSFFSKKSSPKRSRKSELPVAKCLIM